MRFGQGPMATWLGRQIRGWWPDRNPLRRNTDRAGTAIGVALVVIFAAVAPLAAHAAANSATDISRQELRAQRASFVRVRATVLEAPVTMQAYGTTLGPQATCRWPGPDGQVRAGLAPVPADATKGSTVSIWIDQYGQPVTPVQPEEIPARSDLAATAAVGLLAVLVILAGCAARRALDRCRMAAWDADWLATEPRWTTRR
jgi:hypothetical protein